MTNEIFPRGRCAAALLFALPALLYFRPFDAVLTALCLPLVYTARCPLPLRLLPIRCGALSIYRALLLLGAADPALPRGLWLFGIILAVYDLFRFGAAPLYAWCQPTVWLCTGGAALLALCGGFHPVHPLFLPLYLIAVLGQAALAVCLLSDAASHCKK